MKRTYFTALSAGVLFALAFQVLPVGALEGGRASRNGDVNGDGTRDISDVVFLLSFFFQGGPEPQALELENGGLDMEDEAPMFGSVEILANLPTDAQLAPLPAKLQSGYLSVRRLFETLAAQGPKGGPTLQLRVVATAGTLLETLNARLCSYIPAGCCQVDCEAAYDDCIERIPGDQITEENLDDYLACESKKVRCLAGCPDWAVISNL